MEGGWVGVAGTGVAGMAASGLGNDDFTGFLAACAAENRFDPIGMLAMVDVPFRCRRLLVIIRCRAHKLKLTIAAAHTNFFGRSKIKWLSVGL